MTPLKTSPSKIICVGRNYKDHAKELGNDIPTEPLLFIKPNSSLSASNDIDINQITKNGQLGTLHYECELCIQVGQTLSNISVADIQRDMISGVTLGLDLTLRDMQHTLKSKGHPWERAKAFDNACVLGEWLTTDNIKDFHNCHYDLTINEEIKQQGDTSLMMFPVFKLISDISQCFTLKAGDVIMTGTPKGVGELHQGDRLTLTLHTENAQKSAWCVNVI